MSAFLSESVAKGLPLVEERESLDLDGANSILKTRGSTRETCSRHDWRPGQELEEDIFHNRNVEGKKQRK